MTTATDTALQVASSNFETRRIESVNNDTLRIKPTIGSLAFSLLFVFLGLVLGGLWAASTFTTFEGPGSFPLLLIGVLFLVAGLGIYRSSNEQVLVNRDVGVAFMRSWHPSISLETTSVYKHVEPQDITAIQTISRVVKHRSNRNKRQSTYTEYQVNLCTSDGTRHNAFITLEADKARTLGDQLAQMFSVPLHAL